MLAYPTESQKGKFIGIFWSIFNLGGVVGASVSLGQNFHSEVSKAFILGLDLDFFADVIGRLPGLVRFHERLSANYRPQ